MDKVKSSYELRLMEQEEILTTEQIKCREVTKTRVEQLESEIKQLRVSDQAKTQKVKEKTDQLVKSERDLAMEKDLQTKLRQEINEMQKGQKLA